MVNGGMEGQCCRLKEKRKGNFSKYCTAVASKKESSPCCASQGIIYSLSREEEAHTNNNTHSYAVSVHILLCLNITKYHPVIQFFCFFPCTKHNCRRERAILNALADLKIGCHQIQFGFQLHVLLPAPSCTGTLVHCCSISQKWLQFFGIAKVVKVYCFCSPIAPAAAAM